MAEKYELRKKRKNHSNGDGHITKNGHTMMQFDIVTDLERKNYLEEKIKEYDLSENTSLSDVLLAYHNWYIEHQEEFATPNPKIMIENYISLKEV